MAGAGMMFASVCSVFRALRGPVELHARCCTLSVRPFGSGQTSQNSMLPPKPKRPRVPYIAFATKQMVEIKQNNPGMKQTDVLRTAGKMWKTLTESDKKEYEPSEGLSEARKRYREELKVWQNSLTTQQELEIKMLKQQRQKRLAKLRNQKRQRQLNKPPKPTTNAFIMFVQSKQVERGDAPITMYIKGLAELWHKMPTDDKKIFVDQAEDNKTKYMKELTDWEDRMITEGNLDMVRKFRLPKPEKKTKVAKKRVVKKKKTVAKKKAASKKKKTVTKKKKTTAKSKPTSKSKPKKGEENVEDVSWMRDE